MDITGHKKITQAIENGMRYGEYARVIPTEDEFNDYSGEDKSMSRYDRVKYLDVVTHALPSLVLNSLSEGGLLADGPEIEVLGDGPRLVLVGITDNGRATTLTFNDLSTI